MIGAIIGDVVGSRFEFNNKLTRDFEFFTDGCYSTDDTVCTCAIAKSVMEFDGNDYVKLRDNTIDNLVDLAYKYPDAGFGGRFYQWLFSGRERHPYNSFGNGSAMRVSPVGFAFDDYDDGLAVATAVTDITHNQDEGIKGACVLTVAIQMARHGEKKKAIEEYIRCQYDCFPVEYYHSHSFGHGAETCQVSMPQAFSCFLEANNFEETIRNCIYIGGDCDTTGAIAGALAEAYYGVPGWMKKKVREYLTDDLLKIVDSFEYLCEK